MSRKKEGNLLHRKSLLMAGGCRKKASFLSGVLFLVAYLLAASLAEAAETDISISLKLNKDRYSSGEQVGITARTYMNDILILSLPIELEIITPDGKTEYIGLTGTSTGEYRAVYDPESSGEYIARARVGIVGIEAVQDSHFTVMDEDLLFELSPHPVVKYEYGPVDIAGNISVFENKMPMRKDVRLLIASPGSPFYNDLCTVNCDGLCSFSCKLEQNIELAGYKLLGKMSHNSREYMSQADFIIELEQTSGINISVDSRDQYLNNESQVMLIEPFFNKVPLTDALINVKVVDPSHESIYLISDEILPGKYRISYFGKKPGVYSLEINLVKAGIFGTRKLNYTLIDRPDKIITEKFFFAGDTVGDSIYAFSPIDLPMAAGLEPLCLDLTSLQDSHPINYTAIRLMDKGRFVTLNVSPKGICLEPSVAQHTGSDSTAGIDTSSGVAPTVHELAVSELAGSGLLGGSQQSSSSRKALLEVPLMEKSTRHHLQATEILPDLLVISTDSSQAGPIRVTYALPQEKKVLAVYGQDLEKVMFAYEGDNLVFYAASPIHYVHLSGLHVKQVMIKDPDSLGSVQAFGRTMYYSEDVSGFVLSGEDFPDNFSSVSGGGVSDEGSDNGSDQITSQGSTGKGLPADHDGLAQSAEVEPYASTGKFLSETGLVASFAYVQVEGISFGERKSMPGAKLSFNINKQSLSQSSCRLLLLSSDGSMLHEAQAINGSGQIGIPTEAAVGSYILYAVCTDQGGADDSYLMPFHIYSDRPSVQISGSHSSNITRNSKFVYRHEITNNNYKGSDIINIFYTTNFTSVKLFYDDAKTLLADTDRDGLLDTGILGPGERSTIVVEVSIPGDVAVGSVDELRITARSSSDPDAFAQVTDLTRIIPFEQALKDPYKADMGILGISVVDRKIFVTVRNDDRIDRQIRLTTSLDRSGRTYHLSHAENIPGGTTVKIAVDTADLGISAASFERIYSVIRQEDGRELEDADPSNDYYDKYAYRQWWDDSYSMRIGMLYKERLHVDHDRYIIKTYVELPQGIDPLSMRVFYNDGTGHVEGRYSVISANHFSRSVLLAIELPDVKANTEGVAYLYIGEGITQGSAVTDLEIDTVFNNNDARRSGRWVRDNQVKGFLGADYLHDLGMDKGYKSVVYDTPVEKDNYELYAYHPADRGFADNAPVIIEALDKTEFLELNEKINGGQWSYLGAYTMGPESHIRLENFGTVGVVVADAFRLRKVSFYSSPYALEMLVNGTIMSGPDAGLLQDLTIDRMSQNLSFDLNTSDTIIIDLSAYFASASSLRYDTAADISVFFNLSTAEVKLPDGFSGSFNMTIHGQESASLDLQITITRAHLNLTGIPGNISDCPVGSSCYLNQESTANLSVSGLLLNISGDDGTMNISANISSNISSNISTNISANISANISINISGSISAPGAASLVQHPAKVGEPVIWTMKAVSLEKGANITIPLLAHDISISQEGATFGSDDLLYIIANKSFDRQALEAVRLMQSKRDAIDHKKQQAGFFSRIAISLEESGLDSEIRSIGLDPGKISDLHEMRIGLPENLGHVGQKIDNADITYSTPPAQKKERASSDPGMAKQIIISSEMDIHYRNISAQAEISPSKVRPRLYHFIDGRRLDVTNLAEYMVEFLDSDSDGLFDTVSWNVPQLSEQIFEVGIATINTRKSIYHPGEAAEIVIVVLDRQGHLMSDADVSVQVTDPGNNTMHFSTGSGDIWETTSGIYEMNYTQVAAQGTYDISVLASSENFNYSMYSWFEADDHFDFDIIRNSPVTTDPWQGPFASTIQIIAYTAGYVDPSTGIGHFDFTEVIPLNLSISGLGGASQEIILDKRYLTWKNLTNGSTVTYSVQPPKVTPEIYMLGESYVEYTSYAGSVNISEGSVMSLARFSEARPWYIAIDPIQQVTKVCSALTTSGFENPEDATGTCAHVNLSDNVYPSSDGDLRARTSTMQLAVLEQTFDADTDPDMDVVSVFLFVEWRVSKTAGATCTLQVDNGSGYSTFSTTCYDTEAVRAYNISSYFAKGNSLNGMKFKLTYDGNGNNEYLYVDHIYVLANITVPPNYNQWGLNVSSGSIVQRGKSVKAFAFWNYTDGITDALIEHNGNGTYVNYTISGPFSSDWTNYTLDTSDTSKFSYAGLVTVNAIYAKDVDGYRKTLPSKAFYIYDYANISESSLTPTIINQTNQASFACRVMDYNLQTPIEDYTVYFYRNNTYLTSVKTNSTGWARYTGTFNTPNQYNMICNISNSGFYYKLPGGSKANRTLKVLDNVKPSITVLDMPNGYETTSWPVWSNFSVTDISSGILNCTIFYYNASGFFRNVSFTSVTKNQEYGYELTRPSYDNITWFVKCYDNSQNKNMDYSANRTYRVIEDKAGPVIGLIAPPDVSTTYENVSFIFNATDALNGVSNCSVFIDGNINGTNTSMVEGMHTNITSYDIDMGTHTWQVRCYDNSPNKNLGVSAIREFTVGQDTTGPQIMILAPANLTTDTDGYMQFRFTANDFMNGITNCSLYINGTINQTNSSMVEGALTIFNLSALAPVEYLWYIGCYDDSSNYNLANSSIRVFDVAYDLADPDVTLIWPQQAYQSITGDMDFIYNVTDVTGISDCSLLIDGIVNATDTTVTMGQNQTFAVSDIPNGDHNWTVSCIDSSDSHNQSAPIPWNFSVGPDTIPPTIVLYAPNNNTIDSDGVITFTYSTDDVTSGIDSCKLIVNSTQKDLDNSITESIVQELSTTLIDGTYEWYINCTDNSPAQNQGQSQIRILTVSISYKTNLSMIMDDGYVAQGETLNATAVLKDSVGNNIVGANVYSYIVRNPYADNQTLPWLNSSFSRRIEIPLTNSLDSAVEYSPVNVTVDTASLISAGLMEDDCSDIRFGDQGNYYLDYYMYDADNGCNTTTTKFLVDLTRLWDQRSHMVGIYFNNSSVASAQTRSAFPVVDNFDDGDTFASSYWPTDYTHDIADRFSRSSANSYDGTYSARADVLCGNECQGGATTSSSFYKSIQVESNSTLYWRWAVSNAAATMQFNLDGGAVETSTTSTSYVQGSWNIPEGTHEIRFTFTHGGRNLQYQGYVDQIFLITNDVTVGAPSTQSLYVATLVSDTTDADGQAQFTWDTTGYASGNYSITSFARKGSYWEDNAYYHFRIGSDIENPSYLLWGLNVTNAATVYRGSNVLAYSRWYDKVELDSARIEHNATSSFTNYTIAGFGGGKYGWANYTLNTSQLALFPYRGLINVSRIYANDTSGNSNYTSPSKYFYLYGRSEINQSALNTSTVSQNRNFTFTCHVRDEFTQSPISGYPVKFYFNGTLRATINSDVNGDAVARMNATLSGIQPVRCLIGNLTSKFYHAGTVISKTANINVTDSTPPAVVLIAPSDLQLKTTKFISFSVRPTDATLSTCVLWGDWGAGWSAKQTRGDFISGSINQFSTVEIYNGEHQWYVKCNDSFGNIGTSPTWKFNISIPAPTIALVSPPQNTLNTSPQAYLLKYTPTSAKDLDNCSLYINGAFNQTNSTPLANQTHNFTAFFDFGSHQWQVRCFNNESVEGTSNTRNIRITRWYMHEPSAGAGVDRDSLIGSLADSLVVKAYDVGLSTGLNISFIANMTSPQISGNSNKKLGWNLSSLGNTQVNFNPGSAYYAGDYVVWSNATAYGSVSLNTTNFTIFGSLDLLFESLTEPGSEYDWGDIINVTARVYTKGPENASVLNSTYLNYLNVTMTSPSAAQILTSSLVFNGTTWNRTISTSAFTELGEWNFSLHGQSDYHQMNYTAWRIVNITDTGGPVVMLSHPGDGSYLHDQEVEFNFTALELAPDTCSLWANWSAGWHLNSSMSYSYGDNTFGKINLTDGSYVWNVFCNDTSSNNGSVAANYTFTVDTIMPEVHLENPQNRTIEAPGLLHFYYNVTDMDTISNCSLYFSSARNATNSTVARGITQNISVNMAYGEYDWSINCTSAHGQSSLTQVRKLYIPQLLLDSPADGSVADRDSVHADPDSLLFRANLSLQLEMLNITFFINLTDPLGTGASYSIIQIGSNLTNSSGEATFSYDPPSSLHAGRYSWWAEIINSTHNSSSTGFFYNKGAMNISFFSALQNPGPWYAKPSQVHVWAKIVPYGIENQTELNTSYDADINATFSMPNGIDDVLPLVYNGTLWNNTYPILLSSLYGNWNITVDGQAAYMYLVQNQTRVVYINSSLDIGVLDIIGLENMSCLPWLTYAFYVNVTNLDADDVDNFTLLFYINDALNATRPMNLSGFESVLEGFNWSPTLEGIYNISLVANLSSSYAEQNLANNNLTYAGLTRENMRVSSAFTQKNYADASYNNTLTLRNMVSCAIRNASVFASVPDGFTPTGFSPPFSQTAVHLLGNSYLWTHNFTGYESSVSSYNITGSGNYHVKSSNIIGQGISG